MDPKVSVLIASVTQSDGGLEKEARSRLLQGGKGPALLASYVSKVRSRSSKLSDQDLSALTQAGFNQDAIFEATVAAALGEGLARLKKGESLLKKGSK